ncbi:hypothetical protein P4C99_20690, partial [Pontiellaceae bacterium B1224]|nr:hypothetical protein [Pontiellaceae bacterium B1224]
QRILMPRWKIKALNSSGIRKLCSGWRKGKIAEAVDLALPALVFCSMIWFFGESLFCVNTNQGI